MPSKIQEKISQPTFQDFLKKFFSMTALLYLLFFGLETILPGLIIGVLNFNLLLFLVLGSLALMILGTENKNRDLPKLNSQAVYFLISAIIFLSLVLIIALYKISIWESLIYLTLVLLVGSLLWKRF